MSSRPRRSTAKYAPQDEYCPWSEQELTEFWELLKSIPGRDENTWREISQRMSTIRSPETVAALYNRHKKFLSLQTTVEYFIAAESDISETLSNSKESENFSSPRRPINKRKKKTPVKKRIRVDDDEDFEIKEETFQRKSKKRKSITNFEDLQRQEEQKENEVDVAEDSAVQSLLNLSGENAITKRTKVNRSTSRKGKRKRGASSSVTTRHTKSKEKKDNDQTNEDIESKSVDKECLSDFESEETYSPHTKPRKCQDNSILPKRLSSALDQSKLKKWCLYEWFYSEVDRNWFQQNPFKESLIDMGLGHLQTLTSTQWKYIRSIMCNHWYGMGGPRRFSTAFLKEEREKLHQERVAIRKQREVMFHSSNLNLYKKNKDTSYIQPSMEPIMDGGNTLEGVYPCPPPLPVNTKVLAIHPLKREVMTGIIINPLEKHQYTVRFCEEKLPNIQDNDTGGSDLKDNEDGISSDVQGEEGYTRTAPEESEDLPVDDTEVMAYDLKEQKFNNIPGIPGIDTTTIQSPKNVDQDVGRLQDMEAPFLQRPNINTLTESRDIPYHTTVETDRPKDISEVSRQRQQTEDTTHFDSQIQLSRVDTETGKQECHNYGIYSVYTRQDLERVCKLYSLLSQKEHLQQELTQLNDEADEKASIKVPLTTDFQMYYVWVFLKLGKINEKIASHLEALLERQKEIVKKFPHLSLPASVTVSDTDGVNLSHSPTHFSSGIFTPITEEERNLLNSPHRRYSDEEDTEEQEFRGHKLQFPSIRDKTGTSPTGIDWYTRIASKCLNDSREVVEGIASSVKISRKNSEGGGETEQNRNTKSLISDDSDDNRKGKDYIIKCVDLVNRIAVVAREPLDEQEMRLLLEAALTSIRPQNPRTETSRLYRDVQTLTGQLQDLIQRNFKSGKAEQLGSTNKFSE